MPGPPRPTEVELVDASAVADTHDVLVWRFSQPVLALSSAPVGGGAAALDWLVNIGVTDGYDRTDLDTHAAEVVDLLGLRGTGAALLTATAVGGVCSAEEEGVRVDATVGVTRPTWAADRDGTHALRGPEGWRPGTINIVVQLPVGLTPGAAVNAVVTATEAKTQALIEAGVPGTGTASDAVVVCWPPTLPSEPFAGPRSTWGARVARSVHRAVADGLRTST